MTLPSFSIHATNHCNYNCKNCLHFAPYMKPKEYSIDEYTIHIDHMINQGIINLPERVMITGGEPFIHSDLPKFIKILVKKYNFPLFLVTNGYWLSGNIDKYMHMLESLHELVISNYSLRQKDWEVIDKIKKTVNVAIPNRSNFVKISFTADKTTPIIPCIATNPNLGVMQNNVVWGDDACKFLYCIQLLADGRLMKCPIGYVGMSNFPVANEIKNSQHMFYDLKNPREDFNIWRNRYPFDTCYYCKLESTKHSFKEKKIFL